jgi:three-Cys-motif partner protein
VSKTPVVGPWAKEKLEALERYLEFYTKVLKNQTWRTLYVDAFAGGGRSVVRADAKRGSHGPSLFLDAEEVDAEQLEFISGSPRIALEVTNPFSRYVFIDPDPARAAELEALRNEYEGRRHVDALHMDAASGIAWVISDRICKKTHRGVAFLDPFGAKLEWSSIQRLADTGLFEVVVNFALNMAIQRMLPNSAEIPSGWRKTLDAYFGTASWYDEVYCARAGGLFEITGMEKRPDYLDRLLKLYCARLKSAFGYVSSPRLFRNTRGAPLYYLIWAGPHPKGLEGADYILKMGERLSRYSRGKSDRGRR